MLNNNSVVRMATKQDVSAIVKLLEQGKLNATGIEQHIENFLVVEQTEPRRIIGTAGLEISDEKRGLLRSLALDSTYLEANALMELVRILLAFAVQKGVQEIYLLTPSTSFFEFFGFEAIEHTDTPASIQQSAHFRQAKTDLSTVMVYQTRKK
ncbi:hypothetical protein BEP19_12550 [Ammoniphilus oxalaticus]|uniref:N-acetyltransferase domain-containing protein n=1 Tax=Ammoniphilus oxalaticus TaxID=66863 RepID=A0A419SGY8_9BACL|nr:GNAT family N-acetyltransferase [Ammoniphilus oxalaticus]RKD23049.1 hypothetical protein BEP19_12550 [Ammoniphilus oxalaticus]